MAAVAPHSQQGECQDHPAETLHVQNVFYIRAVVNTHVRECNCKCSEALTD